MAVLFIFSLIAVMAGLAYGIITLIEWQDDGITFTQRRQDKRQEKGKKILEDLLTLNDLGDATIQIPAPLLTRIDDWVNKRGDWRMDGWNRRYRQLAGILHDINHPSDVDTVAVVPSSVQSRIEAWLKAHLRAIGGS